MVGGALIVANSQKARQVVKDSQEDICNKAKSLKKQCKCDCEESEPSDKAKLKE
jgi:chaperonin cofactor prefoldin